VIGYLVAAAVAVVLSELAFDPQDTAFWQRWLGRRRYMSRRILLALVPATAGAVAALSVPGGSTVGAQLLRGGLAGVAAAAVLRADTGRVHIRRENPRASDVARTNSALAWAYDRMCRRLDALAARRIRAELGRQKLAAPDCVDLLSNAEEVAGVLTQESRNGRARAQRELSQLRLAELRTGMDVVTDPLATDGQRRSAAFEVAEILADEFVKRRWDRHFTLSSRKGAQ